MRVRRLDARQRRERRDQLINIDGKQCKTCKTPLFESQMTIDHIIPVWKHGTNKVSNLQILCDDCHKQKTKKERNYCIPDFMYHRWVNVVSIYRHKAFLRKLVRVKNV